PAVPHRSPDPERGGRPVRPAARPLLGAPAWLVAGLAGQRLAAGHGAGHRHRRAGRPDLRQLPGAPRLAARSHRRPAHGIGGGMLSSNAQSQAPARSPWMRAALLALACIGVLAAWYAVQARGPADPLQRQAEDYVRLALELGRLHPAEVDSYFGPAALDGRARGSGPGLEELRQRAVTLLGAIRSGAGGEGAAPEAEARRARLIEKVEHLVRVLDLLAAPGALSFAEEARLLYGVALPTLDPQDFEAARQELEALLPGSGTLAFRLATFRNQAVVPGDKRQAV